jgi:branched-chain amino acid transport system ATP-binding protein
MNAPALQARGISRCFGGLVAVDDVDLVADIGLVTAVIGPNGAGKSTLFACLAGQDQPDAGQVMMFGSDVTRLSPDARARRGMARTFQRIAVFSSLSVADNVRVGAENRRRRGLFPSIARASAAEDARAEDRVQTMLDLLGLRPFADQPAAQLPTGILRLVELARALSGQPQIVLLDEPASGLDDEQMAQLPATLRAIAADGCAVLVVEHDLSLVFAAADVVHVLAAGRIVQSGPPAEIRADTTMRAGQ